MQDDQQLLDQANANVAKLKRLAKIAYMLLAGIIAVVIILTISTMIKPSQSANKLMGEDWGKYQQEIEVLKSKLKQVEDMQSRSIGSASDTHTMAEMRTNFDTRITRIEDLLQGDPVRSLSVPLLRRDLDNMSLRITEYQVAVREDFNRIYNVFMWAFGILIAVIFGAFAYFQRKLDAIGRSNGKE